MVQLWNMDDKHTMPMQISICIFYNCMQVKGESICWHNSLYYWNFKYVESFLFIEFTFSCTCAFSWTIGYSFACVNHWTKIFTSNCHILFSKQCLSSDLSKAVAGISSVSNSSSEGDSDDPSLDPENNNKPYAGYRRTNSFDRFPFMSRPLRSASRAGAGSTVPSGTGVQSLTNPNVLFCTPQDIRRATLSRYWSRVM